MVSSGQIEIEKDTEVLRAGWTLPPLWGSNPKLSHLFSDRESADWAASQGWPSALGQPMEAAPRKSLLLGGRLLGTAHRGWPAVAVML